MGNIDDISRPPRSAVAVRSALATANRSVSSGSRTKARTTRMPVICSRSTRLMLSMYSCMRRKVGTIWLTIMPEHDRRRAACATSRTIDSPTSWRSAMTTPTTIVMGAAMAMVQAITTSICTCWTSLVMRVMSDGAPNVPTSRAEKSVTWWKSAARTSRPKPIATRAPTRTAATAKTTWMIANSEHEGAARPDEGRVARRTPWSMMSALRAGRLSAAATCTLWSTTSRTRSRL